MRCRPGDLAVIIRSKVPENIGKFVTVIELAPKAEFFLDGVGYDMRAMSEPCWVVKPMNGQPLTVGYSWKCLFQVHGRTVGRDSGLWPIRPASKKKATTKKQKVKEFV